MRYWAPEKDNTATNTLATDVFSAGMVVYEMLSVNNGPEAVTFSELVEDVSDLRADESDGVRQELNLSIAIPHAAIEEPLRELLRWYILFQLGGWERSCLILQRGSALDESPFAFGEEV